MTIKWLNEFTGVDGGQLTTGTVGCDDMNGGAGGNATFVDAGSDDDELASNGVFARFTATRRAGNAVSGSLIRTFQTWRCPEGDPPAHTDMLILTAGGVNHVKAGWRMSNEGRPQLLGGGRPNGSISETQKQYADLRNWASLHVYDLDGVLLTEPDLAGEPMQHMFFFDRLGHLEQHIMATIDDVTPVDDSFWGICTDAITWTADFGAPFAATEVEETLWKVAVDWIRQGGATRDRFEIAAQVQGVTHLRLTTTGPTEIHSPEVAVGMEGWAKFEISGLPVADSVYYQTVEGKDSNGNWSSVGDPVTQVTTKGPTTAAHTTVIGICHRKDDGSSIWGDIPARVPTVDNFVWQGDESYDNPMQNPGDWQAVWSVIEVMQRQHDAVHPMKDMAQNVDYYFMPDDHDLNLENVDWGGMGHGGEGLLLCWEGIKATRPLGPAPVGMPSTGIHYSSIDRAGFCHVYTCFNSVYRDDPDDAEPTWNPGDPAPSKSPFGAAQDAWLEDLATRADYDTLDGTGIVGYVLHLTKGLYGDAAGSGWDAKNDHHAFYSAHRDWLIYTFGQRRCIWITGDNHIFGYVAEMPDTNHNMLIHPGGAFRESGNTTWDPQFDETYPDVGVADVDLQGFGIVTTRRQGSNVTISGVVRDSFNGFDRFEVGYTWSDAPDVGLPGAGMAGFSYTIDGFDLTDVSEAHAFGLRPNAPRRPIPAKEAGLVPSVFGGSLVGSVRRLPHRITIPMIIRNYDESGYPSGNSGLDANEDIIRGLINYEGSVVLGYCPVAGEPPTMEIDAYMLTNADPVASEGFVFEDLELTLDIMADSWRATTDRMWVTSAEHNLGSSTEGVPIPIFDGSTAKNVDSWHRFKGPMTTARITDWRTQVRMTVTKPGTGSSISAGEYLLVNTMRRKAWVLTTDSWDPDEGEEVFGWVQRRGPGRIMLPLTPMPADGNPRVRRVYVRAQFTGTNSESQWAVMGRPRY